MGAPFSTMNATRTPPDRLLGGIRILRPASSKARSATSNATCGTCRTRSGTAASASKRIHSTPLAFLVADDNEFQLLQVGLARLRFGSRNSDAMIPAHCFSLAVG